MNIKEIRKRTNMTQKAFAEYFGIPISTLRKWEQNESRPADYFVELLIKSLPCCNEDLKELEGLHGEKYYYDKERKIVFDQKMNSIRIEDDNLNEIKSSNLRIYLNWMFKSLYEGQEQFEMDCKHDRISDAIWSVEN
ncbi:MAG: helix-turn-helix domain-containing protein [Erysipelotrichaceae bacterium]|nr:helix-turn-helix domain-containing protein [Erysipelotrichaceae bacterium]